MIYDIVFYKLCAGLESTRTMASRERRYNVYEALELFWAMEERGDPVEPPSSPTTSEPDDDCYVPSSSDERYTNCLLALGGGVNG